MATFFVYALSEPITGHIRYVGKTCNLARRLAEHLSRSSAPNVREWVARIGRPEIRVLEECASEDEALFAEQRWIRDLRASCDLLNIAIRDLAPKVSEPAVGGFGKRCVARRKELGLSQGALARRAGITQCSLCRIEQSPRATLNAESAVALARALGTSVEELVIGRLPNLGVCA